MKGLFWTVYLLTTAGLGAYFVIMLLIMFSGACKSEDVGQIEQQVVMIGNWKAEFVSERFCQCYESKYWGARYLPQTSIGLFGFVLLTLLILDWVLLNDKSMQPNCLNVSKGMRTLLGVTLAGLTWLFYSLLITRTHRDTCAKHLEKCQRWGIHHDEDLHFLSTGLFFLCFVLLWVLVLWHEFNTNKTQYNGWLRFWNAALVVILVITLILFGVFAANYVHQRDSFQSAIVMEYIIFVILVAQCVLCLFITTVYEEKVRKVSEELDVGKEENGNKYGNTYGSKGIDTRQELLPPNKTDTLVVQDWHHADKVRYVTLNTDIL